MQFPYFGSIRKGCSIWVCLAAWLVLPSCGGSDESQRPQQAGQAIDHGRIAAHVAQARVQAALGNSAGAEAHARAIADEVRRSARMADPNRPIHHEAARTAVRDIAGIRSSVWIDHENLMVMVDGPAHRNAAMIDTICMALEPLGDTLAVVVNVQDVTARSLAASSTLSRNCQLPEGQPAFSQRHRQIDVVSEALREAFEQQQSRR